MAFTTDTGTTVMDMTGMDMTGTGTIDLDTTGEDMTATENTGMKDMIMTVKIIIEKNGMTKTKGTGNDDKQ